MLKRLVANSLRDIAGFNSLTQRDSPDCQLNSIRLYLKLITQDLCCPQTTCGQHCPWEPTALHEIDQAALRPLIATNTMATLNPKANRVPHFHHSGKSRKTAGKQAYYDELPAEQRWHRCAFVERMPAIARSPAQKSSPLPQYGAGSISDPPDQALRGAPGKRRDDCTPHIADLPTTY